MRVAQLGIVERGRVDRAGQVHHRVEVGPHADGQAGGADPFVSRACPWPPCQPSPSPPRRLATGTRASSKKISQNISSPVMSRIGTDVDARRLHVDDQRGDAFVLALLARWRSGSVRTRNRPHLAMCAVEIQIFCPLRT